MGDACDLLNKERSTRRQEFSTQMKLIQDTKIAIDNEKSSREALENRHCIDMQELTQCVETFSTHGALLETRMEASVQSAADICRLVEQQSHSKNKMYSNEKVSNVETRFLQLSDRCAAVETRLEEATCKLKASINELAICQVRESPSYDPSAGTEHIDQRMNTGVKFKDVESAI